MEGEVEQIALMKPKTNSEDDPGLLEYLEEIIGSNKYKKEIEKLDDDCEKLIEEKREKRELVKISENELEKLEDSKETAIEFVKREKQIYQINNILLQVKRKNDQNEVIKIEVKLVEVQTKLREEQKKQKEKMIENQELLNA